MGRIHPFGTCAFAASALLLAACAGPGKQPPSAAQGPDIVPVPQIVGFSDGTAIITFCDRDDAGALVVTIRNQGTTPAMSAFESKVSFDASGSPSQIISTPAGFAAGDIQVTPVPIPAGCFNPDCDFIIEVDVNDAVAESNEDNNVGSGRCIG